MERSLQVFGAEQRRHLPSHSPRLRGASASCRCCPGLTQGAAAAVSPLSRGKFTAKENRDRSTGTGREVGVVASATGLKLGLKIVDVLDDWHGAAGKSTWRLRSVRVGGCRAKLYP